MIARSRETLAGAGDDGWAGDRRDLGAELAGERALLAADVGRALARLPERDRVLVRLRYGDDLAQTTIASRLGMPDATIRVRLHRLRKQLTGELGDLR
jgi:RNA polymerase sigma factor (sigma-70 family)